MTKRTLHTALWLVLIALCPVPVCAERIPHEHNFQSMVTNSEITLTNSNKTATTNLLTYQCSGTNATFGKDHYLPSASKVWSFKLLDNGSTVTTTRIDELAEFWVGHYPPTTCTNLKVYVSKDSITWSPALTGDSISYETGYVTVTIPRNNYYVRFRNSTAADVSIIRINWYQDHCSCFTYEP